MKPKPIKITPAKLDRTAKYFFRSAVNFDLLGLSDAAEKRDLAGTALRRWAEQLRAEKKGGRKS